MVAESIFSCTEKFMETMLHSLSMKNEGWQWYHGLVPHLSIGLPASVLLVSTLFFSHKQSQITDGPHIA